MRMNPYRLPALATLLLAGLFAIHPVRAAQSYDNCAGFIDTLPATISTQGTWCLRKDLATNITSGNAIEIATNNVTIDCNDFKLGGLAAGNGSQASGIFANNRQNITIRHCNIRGFFEGVGLSGAGHLVEDNRFDNNLFSDIEDDGAHGRVRRNALYDTGGATGRNEAWGIFSSGDIVDNVVDGVFADPTQPYRTVTAIGVGGDGAIISGNRIGGLAADSTFGIRVFGYRARVSDNQVMGASSGAQGGRGIDAPVPTFCIGNSVSGFGTDIYGCLDSSANYTN